MRQVCSSMIANTEMKDSWSASSLNVETLVCYDLNVRGYKITSRPSFEGLWDEYQPKSFHSTYYDTRHCKDSQIPRCRTEFVKPRLSLHSSQVIE